MVRKRILFRRAVPAFGLALVASLALSAGVASSASAAIQQWYVGGAKLAYNTPAGLAANGTTSFTLKWKAFSNEFEFNCTTQKSEGTIENPKVKEIVKSGTVKNFWFKLTGCTAIKQKKCTLSEFLIVALAGEATEFEGKPAVKIYAATGGSHLFDIHLGGAECGWKNTFSFYGSFIGIANNATSSLEFTKASTATITYGTEGAPATIEGTSKMDSSGKSVTLAP